MKTPIVGLAVLFLVACGAPSEDASSGPATSAESATPPSAAAAATLPNPCDLVTAAELDATITGEAMTQADKTRPDRSVASCDWLGSGESTTNGNIRIESGGQTAYDRIKALNAPEDMMGPLEDLTGIGTAAFSGYQSMSGVGVAVVSFLRGDFIVTVTVGAEESVHGKSALLGMAKDLATVAAGRMGAA